MKRFELYVVDTETTGIDPESNDIIEISFYRLSDGEQKTWYMQPFNKNNIEKDALRINGHKIEDLLHKTSFGKEQYLAPAKAIVGIEQWLANDLHSQEERILVGQNVSFDRQFMLGLWKKSCFDETFPFSKRFIIDTMQIELFLNTALNNYSEYYNLSALVEKYGVKKEKAHRSAGDVKMTKDVFLKQLSYVKG